MWALGSLGENRHHSFTQQGLAHRGSEPRVAAAAGQRGKEMAQKQVAVG